MLTFKKSGTLHDYHSLSRLLLVIVGYSANIEYPSHDVPKENSVTAEIPQVDAESFATPEIQKGS